MSQENEKEKKRGGALPPWMSGSARVGVGTGGAGAGGAGGWFSEGFPGFAARLNALLSTKLASSLIVAAALAVCSYGLLDMNHRGGFGRPAAGKSGSSIFKGGSYRPEDLNGLPGSERGGPSSLDMARNANKGAFDGDAAKAQGAGAEGAKDAASADDKAAAGQQQPGAGQNAGQLQSAGYGKLSSGMNGLSGGGGLSGGIGQNFQQPKLDNSALGQLKGFSPGAKTQIVRGKTPASNRGPLTLRGANARRLESMNRAMAPTRSGDTEAGSATQTQQWANAVPAGSSIQGAGAGTNGGSGLTNGAPTGGSGTGSGAADGPTTDTTGTTDPTTATNVPSTGSSENKTPYQGLVDTATILLLISTLLILAAAAVWLLAKAGGPFTAWLCTAAMYLSYAACAVAAVASVMGIAIMAQGQMMQGAIFTACGALSAYLAWQAAADFSTAATSKAALEAQAANTAAKDTGMEALKQGAIHGAESGAASGLGAGGGKLAGD